MAWLMPLMGIATPLLTGPAIAALIKYLLPKNGMNPANILIDNMEDMAMKRALTSILSTGFLLPSGLSRHARSQAGPVRSYESRRSGHGPFHVDLSDLCGS